MSEPTATQLFQHSVVDDENGQRIDALLAKHLNSYSRVFLRKVVQEGGGRVNGETVKPSFRVRAGQQVEIDLPPMPPEGPQAEEIPLSVLHEDEHLIVIDKPPGMVVHPAKGHWSGTLTSALAFHFSQLSDVGGVTRPGIVHRLDRDTSGLLMVAKHDAAQASLMAQLKARRVRKTYLALVAGSVAAAVGRIEAPIGRDHRHRTRMAVVPDGRPSTTGYRVRERFARWTLLEVDLVTGRTHQIRVHLDAIGHPIAGDPVYGTGTSRRGPEGLARMFLHAWRLELAAPSDGHLIRATAALPPELDGVLEDLRRAETAR